MEIKRDPHHQIDYGRRSAIRKISVGVGALTAISVLPEQWTRPIIEQIVLPAHAAPSGIVLNDPCELTLTAGDQASTSVTVRVRGQITPAVAGLGARVTATASGGSSQSAQVNSQTNSQGAFEATVTVNGGPGITAVAILSSIDGASGQARCSVNVPPGGAATTTTVSPQTTAGVTTTTTTTTTTTAAPCNASAGEYSDADGVTFTWPGGGGPTQLGPGVAPPGCTLDGNPTGVFAGSAAEATGILGSSAIAISVSPSPPPGCGFYVDEWYMLVCM